MDIKKGTRVSLNKAKRAFYFQGKGGINLREKDQASEIIPEEIDDMKLEMIKRAVFAGHLVVGDPVEERPNVKYVSDDSALLEKGVKKMIPFLEEIAKTFGKGERSPVTRLEKLMAQEKKDKNRKTILQKIEELLGLLGGVSSVDEEDIKEEVKINLI